MKVDGFTLKIILPNKELKEEVEEEFFNILKQRYLVIQSGDWRYRDKGYDGELSIFVQVIPKDMVK